MTPLSITAFFDGRLGHEKQTKGILQALSELTTTQIHPIRLPASDFRTGFRNWRRFLWTRLFSGRPDERLSRVDLIIGTGSYTHIPMVLYKERHGGKLVTCMTPDLIFRNKMDLCLVPRHDNPKPAGNIFITVGPPNTAPRQNRHESQKGLILIGGIDHKSHRWNSAQLMIRIKHLVDAEDSKAWTISSSPRTPADMIHLLAGYAAADSRIQFIDAKDTVDGWIEDAYAGHKSVWVTADSVSMVYEAITAGCHVGILPVQWKNKDNKFQRSLSYLIENRLVITYDSWETGQPLFSPQPLNEASRCAREILLRWWPERLQDDRRQ